MPGLTYTLFSAVQRPFTFFTSTTSSTSPSNGNDLYSDQCEPGAQMSPQDRVLQQNRLAASARYVPSDYFGGKVELSLFRSPSVHLSVVDDPLFDWSTAQLPQGPPSLSHTATPHTATSLVRAPNRSSLDPLYDWSRASSPRIKCRNTPSMLLAAPQQAFPSRCVTCHFRHYNKSN